MNLRSGLAAIALTIGLALLPADAFAGPTSSIVSVHDLGTGAGEVWVFLPEHAPECIVTFVHDAGDLSPARYSGWLSYLAIGNECAAVFPRYELSASSHSAASDLRGLRAGIARGIAYIQSSPRVTRKLPVVGAGYAYGGVLALAYAANAASWGLPAPLSVDTIFPVSGQAETLLQAPLPARTRVLVQVGDDDRPGGAAGGQVLWRLLASHPSGRKRLQHVHSTPTFSTVHSAPLQITPEAEVAFWAPLDVLIDAAKG
jgi:hypothetical protein